VDVRYDSLDGQLKRTYTVAPGRDPRQIRWRYQGAQGVTVDPASGDLQISVPISATASMTMTEQAPVAWQLVDNDYVMVPVQYAVERNGRVGFTVGAYDATKPLVIDPVLVYSTYLGGSGDDEAQDVAVDNAGNVYVIGHTVSNDFPVGNPAQGGRSGNYDVFVTKLNPEGTSIVYSTYLGGSNVDLGFSLAVDAGGATYLTGATTSTNFPTRTPVRATNSGNEDVFITKVDPSGAALVYSTYLGGSFTDAGFGLALDPTGSVAITGYTTSTNFPTQSPRQAALGGSSDAFVAKLNAGGTALTYSTYWGGSANDQGADIAMDSSGNAYITGRTQSTNFPTAAPRQSASGGGEDAFVTKFNSAGTTVVYSTYLGGNNDDIGTAIAVDSANQAYVAGFTASTTFPTQAPLQGANAGNTDAFVTKFTANGAALIYSTYLGGGSNDSALDLAVIPSGAATVVGETESDTFPVSDNAIQNRLAGFMDGFITQLTANGAARTFSSYLGGGEEAVAESARAVALDSIGAALVTGYTDDTSFPTANPLQRDQGGRDAFVAKIRMQPAVPATRTTRYAYDGLLRLREAAETPGVTYSYGYDLAGNRTTSAINGIPVEPTRIYDAAHQVQGWAYDLAGNLLNDGTNAYAYDALNRLQTVAGLGQTKQYRYNGDGIMMVGDEYNYTYDLAAPLPRMLYWLAFDTDEFHIYGAGEERLQVNGPFGTLWHLADGLGSVRRVVDQNAVPFVFDDTPVTLAYEPWGSFQSGTLPFSRLGFTGELHDETLGLVHLRARWYNTRNGTFTSRDPFEGFAEQPYSQHPYQYAYSNPVVWTDPSGKSPGDGFGYAWDTVEIVAPSIQQSAKSHIPEGTDVRGFDWELLAALMGAHIAIENNLGERLGRRTAGNLAGFVSHGNPSTGITNMTPAEALKLAHDDTVYLEFRDWYCNALADADWKSNLLQHVDPAGQLKERFRRDAMYRLIHNHVFAIDLLAGQFIQAIQRIGATGREPSVFLVGNYPQYEATNLVGPYTEYNKAPSNWGNKASGGGHGIDIVRIFTKAAATVGVRDTLPGGVKFYLSEAQQSDKLEFPNPQTGKFESRLVSEEEYARWLEPRVFP
jgi:RHS repeat-associated protein